MNRLIAEVSSSTQPTLNYSGVYVYDITGNRIQKAIQSTVEGLTQTETINYEYNANDQLLSEVSSANGTTVYAYDANGSLTTKYNTTQNFSYTFTYNLQNRLSAAQISRQEEGSPVTISSNYAYNQEGLRVKADTTVNGVQQARAFLLDSGLTGYQQVLEELNGPGGNVVKSYVIGDDVISQTVGGTSHYLLYDGHGSTRQLTTDSATITDSYNYDAYGKMVGGDPSISHPAATDLLYAGEQFDVDLQMQYLRARYYDANSGRFNRVDPFEGDNYDPQSLHKYAYAHSDPVNNVDPSGEMIIGVIAVMAIQMSINTWVAGTIINWASGGALFSGLRLIIDFLQEPIVWYTAVVNVFAGLIASISNPYALSFMLSSIIASIITGGVFSLLLNVYSAIDSIIKTTKFVNDAYSDLDASVSQITTFVAWTLANVIATTVTALVIQTAVAGTLKYILPVIGKMVSANKKSATKQLAQVQINKQQGDLAELDFVAAARANGYEVLGTHVCVHTPFGLRYFDVVLSKNGHNTAVEIKSSLKAFKAFDADARRQFAADRWVNMRGGVTAVGQYEGLTIESTIKILWEVPKM